jgi:hypothetical protein
MIMVRPVLVIMRVVVARVVSVLHGPSMSGKSCCSTSTSASRTRLQGYCTCPRGGERTGGVRHGPFGRKMKTGAGGRPPAEGTTIGGTADE